MLSRALSSQLWLVIATKMAQSRDGGVTQAKEFESKNRLTFVERLGEIGDEHLNR